MRNYIIKKEELRSLVAYVYQKKKLCETYPTLLL